MILFPLSPTTSVPSFSTVFPFILLFNYISYASLPLPLQYPCNVPEVSRQPLTAEIRVRSLANTHRFLVNKVALREAFLVALTVFPYQYHSANAPHSSLSWYYCYRKDKWVEFENFQRKQCSFWYRDHGTENYSHYCVMFQWFLRSVLKNSTLHCSVSYRHSNIQFKPSARTDSSQPYQNVFIKQLPDKKNPKFKSTKYSPSYYISSSATHSNNPLPITVTSSLASALLFLQPTFTGRKSGHCLGKFRAVNFLSPPQLH